MTSCNDRLFAVKVFGGLVRTMKRVSILYSLDSSVAAYVVAHITLAINTGALDDNDPQRPLAPSS
jgi:hypothetical protein